MPYANRIDRNIVSRRYYKAHAAHYRRLASIRDSLRNGPEVKAHSAHFTGGRWRYEVQERNGSWGEYTGLFQTKPEAEGWYERERMWLNNNGVKVRIVEIKCQTTIH